MSKKNKNDVEKADATAVDTKTEVVEVVEEAVMVYDMVNPDAENPGYLAVEAKKEGKAARLFYNFGKDLAEMTELFGDTVVFSQARAQMKIKLQAGMRSYLVAGQNVKDLATKFIPGVALERIPTDMNKASEEYFTGLSDDEQDAMIKRLMEAKNK